MEHLLLCVTLWVSGAAAAVCSMFVAWREWLTRPGVRLAAGALAVVAAIVGGIGLTREPSRSAEQARRGAEERAWAAVAEALGTHNWLVELRVRGALATPRDGDREAAAEALIRQLQVDVGGLRRQAEERPSRFTVDAPARR